MRRAVKDRGQTEDHANRTRSTFGEVGSPGWVWRPRGSNELRALARRVADALPVDVVEEVVLTGSLSRGTADEVSDIEMLVVTREPLELKDCFELATAPTLVASFSAPAATSYNAAVGRAAIARRCRRQQLGGRSTQASDS
jgi:Nucleotidyltransferase domain